MEASALDPAPPQPTQYPVRVEADRQDEYVRFLPLIKWLLAFPHYIVLAFLAVAFISLIAHLNRMLNGAPPAGVAVGEGTRWALVPLALCVLVLALLGFVLPEPVETLLDRIVEMMVG